MIAPIDEPHPPVRRQQLPAPVDSFERPLDPLGPSALEPGTREKIELMRERVQMGFSVHCPGDRQYRGAFNLD